MAIVMVGTKEFIAALKKTTAAMDAGTRAATSASASLIQRQIITELGRSSHPKGTPTPSSVGQPPSLVSGQLRRSIKVQGPTSLGLGMYQAQIGPTAIYGRIQELGGDTGTTHLPPRPYVSTALRTVSESGELAQVYYGTWRKVWGGGI